MQLHAELLINAMVLCRDVRPVALARGLVANCAIWLSQRRFSGSMVCVLDTVMLNCEEELVAHVALLRIRCTWNCSVANPTGVPQDGRRIARFLRWQAHRNCPGGQYYCQSKRSPAGRRSNPPIGNFTLHDVEGVN
jgi:hypothetical protein